MTKKKYSDQKIQAALSMTKILPISDVAAKYGISRQTLYTRAAQEGFEIKGQKNSQKKLEKIKKILAQKT